MPPRAMPTAIAPSAPARPGEAITAAIADATKPARPTKPPPTDRCPFMAFPTIAAATISASLCGRNRNHRNPYRSSRLRRTDRFGGFGTHCDEVISLLASAYYLYRSPSVRRDKEINHLFGCTTPLHFRSPHRPRRSACAIISPQPEEPCAARRLEGWNESVPGSILRPSRASGRPRILRQAQERGLLRMRAFNSLHARRSAAAAAHAMDETLRKHGRPGMELSYTQNLEDYHLSLAFADRQSGAYIDVGAGHPIADNVSFWFYERGWRGVVVEPQAELAALYARLRPRDTAVCGLVCRESGEIDFHVVDRLHGFSTTLQHIPQKPQPFASPFPTALTPVVTLAQLCAAHDLDEIDFLKIDVEGGEADVVHGGDWRRYRPKVVVIEAVMPGAGEPAWAAWEPFLLAQLHRLPPLDTLNRFCVARTHPDIFARLPSDR